MPGFSRAGCIGCITNYHSSVSTLHITNGDSAASTLRTFLTDRVLVTCDVLHDGPAPMVDGDAWHDVRARFLAGTFDERYERVRGELAAFDRTVTEPGRYDELVLWFEHDLFDQLLLIRTLDLIGRPETSGQRSTGEATKNISLICIGEFPGVDRFVGLGQLNADQLASLFPRRTPVTPQQFTVANQAWRAFRADDPLKLQAFLHGLPPSFDERKTPLSNVEETDAALPFLRGAFHRLLEEYPSTENGLSRTAQATLRALDSGPLDAGALFPATQASEPRPFLGDLGHFDLVRTMAAAHVPLVTIAPAPTAPDLRGHTISITDEGRLVLDGRADAVALNGIDEWRGGVHLSGVDRSPWRWDPDRERLVS